MKKVVKKSTKRVARKVSVKKVSRGMSKIVILAVIGVFLACAGGVYLFSQSKGGPNAISLIKPALNPVCELKDPELCKFMNNVASQKSYSVTTKGTYSEMSVENTYALDGEDKFQMISKQNGKENSNVITIGDTTYTLDFTDNKWWKQTTKPYANTVNETTNDTKNAVDLKDQAATLDKSKYVFVAKEACGDLTCFKYEIVSETAADGKMFIWFDDRDYLMRKIRSESKDNGSSESVYTYINVHLTAPSPIKEGEPNSMGSQPTKEDIQNMMKQYQQSDQQAPADNSDATNDSSTPPTDQY